MKTSVCVVVVLPTYNERHSIGDLVTEILAASAMIEVVIVDDNSPDGTGAIADEMSRQDSRVMVIHRRSKLGLGSAYRAGFRFALARGATHVVTMDADYSHNPRYLSSLIALADTYDIGVGSRYVAGAGIAKDWGWQRKALSRIANSVTRFSLGLRTHDCTSGFRCYRRRVIESIDGENIKANGYSFLVESMCFARDLGFSLGESPIFFENRSQGMSKIGWGEVVKAVSTVCRLCWLRIRPRSGDFSDLSREQL